jgi:membrane protease YdiL (CAAX protease family)
MSLNSSPFLNLPNSQVSSARQLVYLIAFTIIGLSLASFISLVFLVLVMGYSLADLKAFTNDPSLPEALNVLRISQIFSSIGFFIAPAIVFLNWVQPKISLGLRPVSKSTFSWVLLSILVMVFQLPLINALAAWNKSIEFPDFLKFIETWMQNQELQAEKLTEVFLSMANLSDVCISLFIMAIIPAFGEELLFRGALQSLLVRMTRNPHLAIWIAGFVFSFIHFQFYGFIPRFLLGAFLGYLYYWGGSLWYPIAAHFANNAMAVLFTYWHEHELLPFTPDDIGLSTQATVEVSVSVVILFIGMLLFYKKFRSEFRDRLDFEN